MNLNRRDFLKWASLAGVGAVACDIFREGEMNIQSPVDLPEDLVTGQDNWYATLCQLCPEREGILVRVMEGRAKMVRGNPWYPTNQGKQSVRCEGGLQALYHPDRISTPMIRTQEGGFRAARWDEAMNILLGELRASAGSGSGALLAVTEPQRGHLGTVVNRFAEAYGGRHMALEAMDHTVLRAAVKQTFGQDSLPDFDIESSRYLLSFGADFLSTWVSPVRYARGYGEFRGDRHGQGRGTHVHVDPRYSMTAANADEWIPISPGMEGTLALSIAHVIVSEDLGDPAAVQAMSGGAGKSALLTALGEFSPDRVVGTAGLPETFRDENAADTIRRIAREFASRRPSLAIGGGEAGAHTNGMFNLSAIFALNFLVGSVGRLPGEGGIVFNPPPPIRGLPTSNNVASFSDWSVAARDIESGRFRVLMVHGANPAHGLPLKAGFHEAVASGNPFIVSVSSFMDDTTQMADLILPDRVYLEEWGDDIPEPGPGYEIVGIQQPVVNPLPELDPRSFPDLLLSVSDDLGMDDGLPNTFQELLRQASDELFELGRGSPTGGSAEAPTKTAFWNKVLQQGGWWDSLRVSRASAPVAPSLLDLVGRKSAPSYRDPIGSAGATNVFHLVPFLSNSLYDGRGAHLPWLQAAPDPLTTVTWETWIEINAGQAREMGLKEGDEVRVVTSEDSIRAVVYLHPAMPRNVVGVPLGQGHAPGLKYATREDERRGDNPMAILAPVVDEATGALAWAANRVLVRPTGKSGPISKFEGIVPAFPIGTREVDIVQVTGIPETHE